ncbi:MAG: tripartite tricarboxylate transporter substrate binding protein [Gammaproteobacteria bacterium]|nr:tripartite tricarboxylate transporter substrate binding protein [Gammaproteobacteria bacterium]
MKFSTRALSVTFAGLLCLAGSASAVELPCNTARVLVPWGPGGETDILNRIITDAANRLGAVATLQVVNIKGQGGIKGTKEAAKAKPDGCTVFATFQHVLSSNLTGRSDLTYTDFEPAARMVQTASIIGAAEGAPFNDYKSMQAYAKANPGKVLAGGTLGSTSHFTLLQVQDALDIDMKVVSYDGTADRIKAMLSNTIHIAQVSEATAAKHVQSGKLKVLAINADERSTVLPDLPTAREQGFNLSITSDRGWVLPKGTSAEIVNYYADLLEKVANDPEFIKAITSKGSKVAYLRGEAYQQWWKDTNDDWTRIAKKLGVMK